MLAAFFCMLISYLPPGTATPRTNHSRTWLTGSGGRTGGSGRIRG